MAEDIAEDNPWRLHKTAPIDPSILENPGNLPFSDGVDLNKPVRTHNISAEEMAERAERASKKDSDLSPSEKAMIEEYRYNTTGEYRRRYW